MIIFLRFISFSCAAHASALADHIQHLELSEILFQLTLSRFESSMSSAECRLELRRCVMYEGECKIGMTEG